MNIPSNILTLLAGMAITLFSLWYGQNHHLLPLAASQSAPEVDGLFNVMMTISIALFLLVQGLIVIAVFKFRQKPGDESDGPPIEGNIPLEILWTAIPAVLVLGISIYSFQVYTNMGGLDPMDHSGHGAMAGMAIAGELPTETLVADEGQPASAKPASAGIGASPSAQGKPADLNVNVLGLQYAWVFTYPEAGITSGELHVPVGQDVQLNINAQDVLHAFWIPQFRLKQDAIPGRQTELRFVPTVAGTYPVICAELCGGYHGAMRTQVVVHTPEDFAVWKQEQLVAQSLEISSQVAIAEPSPTAQSPDEFLAPYTQAMAMNPDAHALHQLHQQAKHSAI